MDVFAAQLRVDQFRAALGDAGRELARSAELDELLDAAERNAWTVDRLAHYIAGRLPRGAGPGLVIVTMRVVARSPEPATPTEHQLEATARRRPGTFRQPLPPCGQCDGTPARWLTQPHAGKGQARVIHCPACWTAPPGYVPPRSRSAETYFEADYLRAIADEGAPPID
jgi:hypothetical protein